MAVNIVIIEDHQTYRDTLKFMFSATEGFNVSNEFSCIEDALDVDFSADIILLDINLPGMSGVDGIISLKDRYPSVKVVILTAFEEDEKIFKAILNGADGYLLKKTQPLRIIQYIEDAVSGGSPMSPTIALRTMELFRKFSPKKGDNYELTKREIEILTNLVEGLSNEEISNKLFISIQTVRNHIKHIYEKLHVHSKSQAVIKALKENIT